MNKMFNLRVGWWRPFVTIVILKNLFKSKLNVKCILQACINIELMGLS